MIYFDYILYILNDILIGIMFSAENYPLDFALGRIKRVRRPWIPNILTRKLPSGPRQPPSWFLFFSSQSHQISRCQRYTSKEFQ